ncbi:hypothetical protein BJ912DRAFT_854550 [Pholiota molesta]|nr:hypothetical protein BJ912DRAFT_854550 [Pholiota molesta]
MDDGGKIGVRRQQVLVLPNFAMTDYASQGKTRPFNVVDLNHCKNHQSCYTALSRSSNAAGTVIIQGFSTNKITKGISGYLRQEFRELEMLNTITCLNYENKLPSTVSGSLRNQLIRSYQLWRSTEPELFDKDIEDWHSAMKWQDNEIQIRQVEEDGTWDLNTNAKAVNVGIQIKKKGHIKSTPKRINNSEYSQDNNSITKCKKLRQNIESTPHTSLMGPQWDNSNFSCAYDSLIVILYNLWIENPVFWSSNLINYSKYMDRLLLEFNKVRQGTISIEHARNTVRQLLHTDNSTLFPMGQEYVYISELIRYVIGEKNHGVINYKCNVCNYSSPSLYLNNSTMLVLRDYHKEGINKISDILNIKTNSSSTCEKCPQCYHNCNISVPTYTSGNINSVPHILALEIYNERNRIKPDIEFSINYGSVNCKLRLCGIIYGGQQHFTSRFIDKSGTVWYHDGIETGNTLTQENSLTLLTDTSFLRTAASNQKQILLCIYKRM